MLLTTRRECYSENLTFSFNNNLFYIGWRGILFMSSQPDPQIVAKKLFEKVENGSVESICDDLYGHYFLVAHDKMKNVWYIAIDNSGLYHAFYTDNCVSSSFLEIIKFQRRKKSELDKEAIVEFLQTGCLYSGKSFFKDIKRLDRKTIIRINSKGSFDFLKKKFTDFDDYIAELPSLDEILLKKFEMFENEKISFDITGGIDSRLLVALASRTNMNYSLAISGMPFNRDVKIAQTIAEFLGKELLITTHAIDKIRSEMPVVFKIGDGYTDVMQYHRVFQHLNNRKNAKNNLVISGIGGELFKDLYWMQDFPFYNKRKVNLRKLINTHVVSSLNCFHILSPGCQEILLRLKKKLLNEIHEYNKDTNSRTYDNIYYNWRMMTFGGRYITNNMNILNTYAPLMEPDVVRVGYYAPRRKRFFNRIHREVISKYNRTLSRIETTEGGMSVSSDFSYLLKDSYKFLMNRVMRIVRKFYNRYTGKLIYYESPNNPQIYEAIKNLDDFKNSILVLKEEQILKNSITNKDIPDSLVGRILNLGYLYSYLEN